MNNNIHINPESIGKFMAISDEPSPEGYESPITAYIGQFSQQIIEQRDNVIVAQINEQIGVDVNKNELFRALNYDRNQFNEGYKKGYRDAQKKYERPQGEWIYKEFDEETGIRNSYFCSKCDCPQSQVYINFCGNCGADMHKGG